eukprot:CAMPEP_0167751766 /NCGR_PEP_ID=MMETSP0110_2-20121227/6762_1 /TAXON_ID=629695 /ORGANISM="Gymnochlora sp., Strain CCMP2014" /LENGTH=895 /DNA_ID=CAMNT_0007637301 /DNA_START=1562 /DNA_END=4249 /DNA_ORIENTATION=+
MVEASPQPTSAFDSHTTAISLMMVPILRKKPKKALKAFIVFAAVAMTLSWARQPNLERSVKVRSSGQNVINEARAAGIAAAATSAAQAVSKAVSMRKIEAPDLDKTFIVLDDDDDRRGKVDEAGLPLVYDKDLIEKYWAKQSGALQQRWTEFLGQSVPFLTKVAGYLITGGVEELQKNDRALTRDARIIMEKLGPTYIKLGQTLSVRPDVLPQSALDELAILQDGVKPFPTSIAINTIEAELGKPLGAIFDEISEVPVAAASLAQVYRARLKGTDTYVAVKVQRPGIQETVSKDLYVLRRAAEVYQGLIDRFAPQQRTDYVALLNEWAVGFYTELDFMNEGKNQMRLKKLLEDEGVKDVYVPEVYSELCSRRILVSEWIDGIKLSQCEPDEIRELIDIGQECFLVQLLQVGFFHSDPHPGNLLKMNDTSKGKIALLDFGLMASVKQEDIDIMVNSIIHLANKDFPALVDDFIGLRILPANCDRSKVIPLMDKALSPYVKGGGAKKYEEEIRKTYGIDDTAAGAVGGFQAMTQDALTVLNDIPFSIPPYFALLGRAIVTLEGVALTGNPDYGIIMEAYPFVARKLLREDRPEIQRALQQVLYGGGAGGKLGSERLAVLLNSAMGVVARQDGGAFVDLETIPEDAVALGPALKFVLSNRTVSLRNLLVEEVANAADILLRQAVRKAAGSVTSAIPRPPFPFIPSPDTIPIPLLLPSFSTAEQPTSSLSNKESDEKKNGESEPVTRSVQTPVSVSPLLISPADFLDTAAPKLSREEQLYALSLKDLISTTLGPDAASIVAGDSFSDPASALRFILALTNSGGTLAPELREALGRISPNLVAAFDPSLAEASGGKEVREAFSELGTDETEVLASSSREVLSSIWNRIASRIAPLTSSSQ